jgi:superfamily I DNA/RNA helicase
MPTRCSMFRKFHSCAATDDSEDYETVDLGDMLRAIVAPGHNDLFITGDTHQRIYDSYVSLGSLGIQIRGRSSRLTLSYRTTREILGSALGLLGAEEWDNLDDGTEDLAGYRSLLHGPRPVFRAAAGWPEELDAIVDQVKQWTDGAPASIAVCVPERSMVAEVERMLARRADPLRYRREMKRARSLLFVAATRARDSVVISWHGAPSPFLPRSS